MSEDSEAGIMFVGVCDENGDLYTVVRAGSLAEVIAEIPESWTAEQIPEPDVAREVPNIYREITRDGE